MKKIILAGASIAALTLAAPAYAQSTSTVTQDGSGNQADVEQEESNTSTVTQIGDNNLAGVVQNAGSGNESTISQTATGPNTAGVNQILGTNNSFADITQDGTSASNTAVISQAGALATSGEAVQTDSVNGDILIFQNAGSNNFAAAVQGDSSFVGGTESGATNAESVIQQGGDNNVALSIQTGVDQISLIDQQAPTSGNDASVFQGAFGGGTSDAYILQVGDGDSAEIAQNSSGNDADIGQGGGSGNFALIDQGFVGGAGVGGDNNTAIIAQDGSGNFSAIEQNGLTAGSGNIADVLQAADNNTSFVVQDGSTLTATVNQLTDGNFSSVSQGGTGNTATVNQ